MGAACEGTSPGATVEGDGTSQGATVEGDGTSQGATVEGAGPSQGAAVEGEGTSQAMTPSMGPVGIVCTGGDLAVVDAAGKYDIESSNHKDSRVMLPISDEELLICGCSGIYKMDVKTKSKRLVKKSNWAEARALCRVKTDDAYKGTWTEKMQDYLLCFHSEGLYKISIEDGEYDLMRIITKTSWADTKAVVYDPTANAIYAFDSSGLYRVSFFMGQFQKVEQVSSDGWSECRAALYHPPGAICICNMGIYRVNLSDGSSEKINSSDWKKSKAAIRTGANNALIFHAGDGLYDLDLESGTHKKFTDHDSIRSQIYWRQITCATNLGTDTVATSTSLKH
eukprot:TRINITY_DN10402_c0_g1_i1.p1 TRINITY_DN10402_c0_g1~~TRINITY_DN10402_c0_g1_i1.p1  ORF type:complete len:338 (-),score=38.41 TRINITY_DN10402_c0_g1_i1:22-1035(-)